VLLIIKVCILLEEVIYFNILSNYLLGSPEENYERRSGRQHSYRNYNSSSEEKASNAIHCNVLLISVVTFGNRPEDLGSKLRD
jgi:hypothetical protein